MLHGLVLFATQLETTDTSEVTVLNNCAPPLYSAVSSLSYSTSTGCYATHAQVSFSLFFLITHHRSLFLTA